MILQEDYKNLNIVDRSLIKKLNLSKSNLISPDSEVIVDKVKPREVHNFDRVLEIAEQDDVAAVVFRASRRQLMIIGWDVSEDFGIRYGDGFYVGFSDYAMDTISELERFQQYQNVDSAITVKTMMSAAFLGFYGDDETAKKVWDILVIKKCDNAELRDKRTKAQQGAVPLPNENEKYEQYLKRLKYDLQNRLEKYIDSKREEIHSKADIERLFTSNKAMKKMKICNRMYELFNTVLLTHPTGIQYEYRKIEGPVMAGDRDKYCKLVIEFKGIYPFVKSLTISDSIYSSEDTSTVVYN